jgi:hypothetical protein
MKITEITSIGKRLLADLPGFAVRGQMLFMRPVGHTLRGIFLDRSVNPRGFYVQVFIQPLFVPAKHVAFNVGWRLGGSSHIWNAEAPGLISELDAALKRDAMPFLSSVQLPQDVARAAASLQKSGDPYVQQTIAYALARGGEVQQAVTALTQLVEMLDLKERYPWQLEMQRRAEALKGELRDNLSEAHRRLEFWADGTKKQLGLDQFS